MLATTLPLTSRSERLVALHLVGKALSAILNFEEQCSIDRPLRVSVGRHISGVAPLYFPDEATVQ